MKFERLLSEVEGLSDLTWFRGTVTDKGLILGRWPIEVFVGHSWGFS